MKLRSQFIISLVVFGIILAATVASVILTSQQTANLAAQQEAAARIQRGATNLNYLSNYYFLYQEDLQLDQWHSAFNSLSDDVSNLKLNNPAQQSLVNIVDGDLQNLDSVFDSVVSYLQNAPRNVSVRVDPQFQTQWSRMALQNQGLASDASQLSQAITNQADQLNIMSTALVFILFGTFGVYFLTIYLLIYRRALNSISNLQAETKIIGEGNLDHRIKIDRQDEIGELSQAFNQMTANLKTVTTCKTDLENEVAGRKLAEAALRTSEQRWATTLASIGDAVIATDLLGKVMFMNGVAEELTGWTLSEASLRPVKEIFNIVNEQTHVAVEDPISKVLEKGMVIGLANHTVLIRRNKTEVAIDDSGAPIKDKDGKTTGVVLIFRDITGRKKAEEAINRQASLIDLSPDAIIVWILEGTITFWSKGAEKLYGWTKTEAIGQTTHDLLKTSFPKPLSDIISQIRSRGKWSGELQHKAKDGRDLTVQSSWLAEREEQGEVKSILESNVDITERKRLQEKLEDSATQLEEYASQMEQLADERAKKLKDAERLAAIGATAGMVGHDIRNPLQSIIGDLYLVKEDLVSLPQSEEKQSIKDSLEAIEKSVDYVNKIVADLQDFAKPLNPHIEETDLNTILKDLLFKNGIPDNIKLKVKIAKETQTLTTDPAYMKRILGNLISNAVQAMPDGGRLTINATAKDDNTIITVQDTGIGIPEDAKPRLFQPLFTTKSKGQGFGLSVVKRMTEALGGTVTFESETGKGTKFIIQIPTKTTTQPKHN